MRAETDAARSRVAGGTCPRGRNDSAGALPPRHPFRSLHAADARHRSHQTQASTTRTIGATCRRGEASGAG